MPVKTLIEEAIALAEALDAMDADLSRSDIEAARQRARAERRRLLAQAPGVPVKTAGELLQLSEPTVRRLRSGGVLQLQPDSNSRITLESLLDVRARLDRLRRAGRDRQLAQILLEEVEDRSLLSEESGRGALAAFGRGEYTVVED